VKLLKTAIDECLPAAPKGSFAATSANNPAITSISTSASFGNNASFSFDLQ